MMSRLAFGFMFLVACLALLSQPSAYASKSDVKVVSASEMKASAVIFRDDFDGDNLDSNKWSVLTNTGTISISGGFVQLSRADSSDKFPYIQSKNNPIPSVGNFRVRVGMEFLTLAIHGNGFVVDDQRIPNEIVGSYSWLPPIYSAWQSSGEGFQFIDYTRTNRFGSSANQLGYHVFEFRWVGPFDEYYSDGVLVNRVKRGNDVPRPIVVWFGNPVIANFPSNWTTFKIDFIEIEELKGIIFLPIVFKANN